MVFHQYMGATRACRTWNLPKRTRSHGDGRTLARQCTDVRAARPKRYYGSQVRDEQRVFTTRGATKGSLGAAGPCCHFWMSELSPSRQHWLNHPPAKVSQLLMAPVVQK